MSYTLFDRHSNMNETTLREIGTLIYDIEIKYDRNESFLLLNMLYGLYDGYLYDDLLPSAKSLLDTDEFTRLRTIVTVIETYPK